MIGDAMKKRTPKILSLIVILMLTLVFSASCFLFPGKRQEACSHTNLRGGDCQTPGTCADCGAQVKIGGKFGQHNYRKNVHYPDCTNGGYVEFICSVCGDSYIEDPTDPKGHSYGEWVFAKNPTATESGEMYRECSVCQSRETQTVPAHEHSMAYGEAVTVTCTRDGWSAYEYCTLCEYTTKQVIPALGHSYGPYSSNGDSTHTRVCANDPSHVSTEPCSGGDASGQGAPVCAYCHSEYDFAVRRGNSAYGYEALGTYPAYGERMQKLYKDLTVTCEAFYYSNEDVALDDNYYVIGEFAAADYSLDLGQMSAVWKIFYVSNPLYYWLDAKIVSSGDTLLLTIADDYARAVDRREADTAIALMTEECMLLINDGMTELEKAVTITAYLVENMGYAYENDGTTPVNDMWAHCMAGFAVKGYGVCEAYAKSFMYFCLLSGVDCRMGSGYAGEAHAWNYVKIDGVWYGADITWTDNSDDLAVYDYFGISGSILFSTHTSHSSTVLSGNFIYEPPTLSEKSIEITALYKNGEYVGLYKSIDDAFAAMTDTEAEYEIKIGYYGFFTTSPVHTIKSTATPDVKKLTISGRNEYVGANHLDNNSMISLYSDITLGSDVDLKNLHLVSAVSGVHEIKLSSYKLTLSGDSVYMDSRITGSDTTSHVIVSTTDIAYVYGGVDVYKLTTGSVGIMLGADSRITNCYGSKIYIPQASSPADKVNVVVQNQK